MELSNRRGFLRRAGGVGAGLGLFHIVPASAQGKDGRPAPSNRIVMGCIGVGGMGSGNMNGFAGQPDVQVVAVCDVDQGKATGAKQRVDQRYGNQDCKAYGDFRELLARGDLDAISLATPDHWHAIPAVWAMRAGMDVYGEKPISHCLREGRIMADAQRNYGRIWQTGSWQRSVANFRHGCELVRNGRIGKVVKVEVGLPTGRPCGPVTFAAPPPEMDYDMWCWPSPYAPYCKERTHWNWRWQLSYGGGQLMDWIGHHCDIAHWGMGWDDTGPYEVEGKGDFPTTGIWDAATTYRCTARYAGGVEYTIGNASGGLRSGTKWIGENGHWVWVNRGGQETFPKALWDERIGPEETQIYKSDNHHRNFLDCVRSRQQTITPAEAAHRSASVGHLCQIAMLLGRKIRWNPVTEEILDDASATAMLSTPMRAPWHL